MRTLLAAFAIFALLGCGGVEDEGDLGGGGGSGSGGSAENTVTAGRFALNSDGDCVFTDTNSGCIFSGGEPPSTTNPPTTNPPTTNPPTSNPPTSNPPQLPPEQGGCWVTGIGTFGKGDTRDSFGGNGMTMKDGSVRGEWQHTDHFDVSGTQKNGQNLFHGKVTYIACLRFPTLPGPEVPKAIPNYANWGGKGRFNGVDGYYFDVKAFDHAEGGIHKDRYQIRIFDANKKLVLHADGQGTMQAPSNKECEIDPLVTTNLSWVKALGCISGGNFQIHPPNKGHPY